MGLQSWTGWPLCKEGSRAEPLHPLDKQGWGGGDGLLKEPSLQDTHKNERDLLFDRPKVLDGKTPIQ